jgi:uncharacterized membrane protein
MTSWVVIGWALLAVSVLAVIGLVVWITYGRRHGSAAPVVGFPVFSIDRYLVMKRLLHEADVEFLSRLPGYRPEIGRRLQRAQRKAFRGYLKDLRRDFYVLHAAARRILTAPDANSPELVGILLRQRVAFELELARLHFRLLLSSAGFGEVSARPLVEMLERIQMDLSRYASLPAA